MKNILLKFIIVFEVGAYAACKITEKPTNSFINAVQNLHESEYIKLNLDGAFHDRSDSDYTLHQPFFFFKNGLIYFSDVSFKNFNDEVTQKSWFQKRFLNDKVWGVYKIVDDTISATMYCRYYNARSVYVITNFQGTIINPETIENWHVIAPFPNLKGALKDEYKHFLSETRTLYFKSISYKPFLDSLATLKKNIEIKKY